MVAAFITTETLTKAEKAAADVVKVRALLAIAKVKVKEVDALFLAATEEGESVELPDGTLVTRIDADRRTISADKLADTVIASTFDSVTKTTVVHGKFDAAIKLGTITAKQAAAVTDTTPYTAIKITKG